MVCVPLATDTDVCLCAVATAQAIFKFVMVSTCNSNQCFIPSLTEQTFSMSCRCCCCMNLVSCQIFLVNGKVSIFPTIKWKTTRILSSSSEDWVIYAKESKRGKKRGYKMELLISIHVNKMIEWTTRDALRQSVLNIHRSWRWQLGWAERSIV